LTLRYFALAIFAVCAAAQTPPATEVAQQDANITFKSKVNLVLVPVVVRDKAGKPVANLKQEDFQLFDKNKLQTISRFAVETSAPKQVPATKRLDISIDKPAEAPADTSVPTHFTAWLFDDIHLPQSDLVYARQAAEKYLAPPLDPAARIAIYTTSGQTHVEFTDSLDELRSALSQIRPHPIARTSMQECPDISYYLADLISNKSMQDAITTAATEAYACLNMTPPQTIKDAIPIVEATAQRVLAAGRQETRVALMGIDQLIRRMGAMPGQRIIVLVSPGFQRLDEDIQEESAIIDRAIKNNVTLNSLDARGLYVDMPDISKRTYSVQADLAKQQYDREASRAAADVMAELASGTGGTFFQNSNNLTRGIRDLSSAPETYYVLGFSPQNLKLDGSYHNLKVTLRNSAGLSAKARRGYYAPRHLSDADETAKEEITQALFSREEMRDIPFDIHTQFFKSSSTEARLVVFTRLDVRKLRYRKADGRNNDDVVVVSGLFDRNGNFLQSVAKTLKMSLKDETLAGKLNNGIALRSDFKVVPGKYVLRLVVRDAEGQMMAAQNGAVEIP
jgi:VWFA-related protein